MIMSNVELKELEEQTIARDNRVSCNQIRTKQTSFNWLKERWRRFRVSRLKTKLESMKEDLVTSSFKANSGVLTPSSERRLTRKTNAIERIEQKIKILSKGEVPASYVNHRAIKLREKMMQYMVFNCSNAYSVGMENYDKVFEESPVENPSVGFEEAPQVAAAMAAAKPAIDVAQVSADQQAFASEVNKAMNPASATPISREAIEDAVNQSFEKMVTPPAPTFDYFATPAAPVTPVVTAAPVRPVAEVAPEVKDDAPINRETIENVVNQSFDYFAAPPVKKVEETPAPTFDYFATPAAPVTPVVTAAPVRPVVESTPEVKAEAPIGRETIENVVNQSFDYFATPKGEAVENKPEITPVAEVIPEAPAAKVETPEVKADAPINRETIENVVNQSFDYFATPKGEAVVEKPEITPVAEVIPEAPAAKVETPEVRADAPINRETIKNAVDQSFDYFATPKSEPADKVEEKVAEKPTPTFDYFAAPPPVKEISPEEVQKTVGDNPSEPKIDYSELKNAMAAAVNGVKENSDSDFIEEMRRRKEKYNYTPMTDEEIAKARENIEYDKYERIYKERGTAARSVPDHEVVEEPVKKEEPPVKEEPVRDTIVVAPEREEKKEEEKVEEHEEVKASEERTFLPKKEELHFDYSDATEAEVQQASSYEDSRTGLEALKERLLKIKEEHKKSEQELKDARDEQTDEARKAMEVREASRAKKQDYEDSVKKLKDLCDTLEEETKVNMSSAAISRNDTECNRRFIQMHTAEIHEYEDKIREIDSIISQESGDIKRR